MITIEQILIVGSMFILVAVFANKASEKFGVPALLLFLALGMLAGSEGPGGIDFDDPWLAQALGVTALAIILFSGGLDTQWSRVRPVAFSGALLSTIGVAITAVAVGAAAWLVLDFTLLEGMLLGAIMSSTDAAAVFAVLRSRNLGLPERVQNLLELESGSNDPMAVVLTISVITLITQPDVSPASLAIWLFVVQMALGALLGYLLGWFLVWVVNHIGLETEGLYPALTLSAALFIYGAITYVGGNGFLGVYIAGLIMGNNAFVHKKSLLRFHDAAAWFMQIVMFLILGLQVYPSRLVPVLGTGLLLSVILMFLARPVGVFVTLAFSRFDLKERILIAWVGLRGAVPIILATFPYVTGVPQADEIFNIVFFVVLTSVLLQGTSIPFVVRLLGLARPQQVRPRHPLEFEESEQIPATMMDFIVPYNSPVAGKAVMELGLPEESVIALISRNDKYILPTGSTVIEPGDVLLILLNKESIAEINKVLGMVHDE